MRPNLEKVLATLWADPCYTNRLIFADWFDEEGFAHIGTALRNGFIAADMINELYGNGHKYGPYGFEYGSGHGYGPDYDPAGDGINYGEGFGFGFGHGRTALDEAGFRTVDRGDGWGRDTDHIAPTVLSTVHSMEMGIGQAVLINPGQGFVYIGRIVKVLPPFGLVLEEATMVCQTNDISWDNLLQGFGREWGVYRQFDGLLTLPNVLASVSWEGEIPETNP